jgi:hypothetical protein
MDIQIPTAQQLESTLLKEIVLAVSGIPPLLGACFREQLAAYLASTTLVSVPELASWLVVSTVAGASLSLYFLARYLTTKKALLSVAPKYYEDLQAEKDLATGYGTIASGRG